MNITEPHFIKEYDKAQEEKIEKELIALKEMMDKERKQEEAFYKGETWRKKEQAEE